MPADFNLTELLRQRISEVLNDAGGHLATYWQSDLAALSIFFVGCCCVLAMFCNRIRDTVPERIAFGAVALGAFSRAAYIFASGEIPLDGAWLCYSLAFYCLVLIWKYVWVIPRRPDYRQDSELPHY